MARGKKVDTCHRPKNSGHRPKERSFGRCPFYAVLKPAFYHEIDINGEVPVSCVLGLTWVLRKSA